MVLISELRNCDINLHTEKAQYTEGPDHFDEWFKLVREKLPYVTSIYCYGNKLTELNCPGMRIVDCDSNKLTRLVCDADIVSCSRNKLTELICLNATSVYCNNNMLTTLTCPNVDIVHCVGNQLTELICPNATIIYCYRNQLLTIYCPKINELAYDVYYDNKVIKIPILDRAVKLLNAEYKAISYQDIMEKILAVNSFKVKCAR
jgi:hypothetical protein